AGEGDHRAAGRAVDVHRSAAAVADSAAVGHRRTAGVVDERVAAGVGDGRVGAEGASAGRIADNVDPGVAAVERVGAVEVVGAVGIAELQPAAVGGAQGAILEGDGAGGVVGDGDQRGVVALADVAVVGHAGRAAGDVEGR